MHAGSEPSPTDSAIPPTSDIASQSSRTVNSSVRAIKSIASASNASVNDSNHESPQASQWVKGARRLSLKQQQDRKLFTRRQSNLEPPSTPSTIRTEDDTTDLDNIQDATQPWLKLSRAPGQVPPQILDDPDELPPAGSGLDSDLDTLVLSYEKSDVARSILEEIHSSVSDSTHMNGQSNGHAHGALKISAVKAYARVGLWRQFAILSHRTWKNLYRNPMLMLSHYAISILVAVLCGYLFYGLTDDIPGFQNRLGLLFFILALLGFSTLTSLAVFSGERLLFLRERANGYYKPITYFASKIVFDIVPLRLIPPVIIAVVVYPMTGLVAHWPEFFKFVLVLVLFNLAAAAICLLIGIVFRDTAVANLIGSLVMLFSLLFAGFLLNHEAMPPFAAWLQKVSFTAHRRSHYAKHS